MKRLEIKKLYRRAWHKWGLEPQLGMLMEESAELIQATNKVLRQHKKKTSCWRGLVEEIADVEIMIDQIKTMVNWEDLDKRVEIAKHDKLLRLKNILDESPKSTLTPHHKGQGA